MSRFIINKVLFAIFVTAEVVAMMSILLGIVSLMYKLVTSERLLFLYGIKSDIFVISVAVLIISAALSNFVDKAVEKKQKASRDKSERPW